jgi:hypothetical protein
MVERPESSACPSHHNLIENMAEAARQGCLWLGGLIEPLEAACTARVWFIIGLALIAAALIAHLKRQRIPLLEVEPLLGELQRVSRRRATCDGRLTPPIALPCRAPLQWAMPRAARAPAPRSPREASPATTRARSSCWAMPPPSPNSRSASGVAAVVRAGGGQGCCGGLPAGTGPCHRGCCGGLPARTGPCLKESDGGRAGRCCRRRARGARMRPRSGSRQQATCSRSRPRACRAEAGRDSHRLPRCPHPPPWPSGQASC